MSLSACDILNKMPLRSESRRRWATGDKTYCVRSAGTSVSHDAADWGFDGNPSGGTESFGRFADCDIATINLRRTHLSLERWIRHSASIHRWVCTSQRLCFYFSFNKNYTPKNIEKYVCLIAHYSFLFFITIGLLLFLCFYEGVNFIKLLLSFFLIYL